MAVSLAEPTRITNGTNNNISDYYCKVKEGNVDDGVGFIIGAIICILIFAFFMWLFVYPLVQVLFDLLVFFLLFWLGPLFSTAFSLARAPLEVFVFVPHVFVCKLMVGCVYFWGVWLTRARRGGQAAAPFF